MIALSPSPECELTLPTGSHLALVDARSQQRTSFDALDALADRVASALRGTPTLVLLTASNDLSTVVALLGVWRAGHCALLWKPGQPAAGLRATMETYRPGWAILSLSDIEAVGDLVMATPLEGGQWLCCCKHSRPVIHQALALLLATSGSMGAPKTVRVTWSNLTASMLQLSESVGAKADDRLLINLPLCHIYGFTTFLSHLLAGASALVSNRSFLDREFVELYRGYAPTTLPGVAFTFDLLRRIGLGPLQLGSIEKMTHSGDRLGPETTRWAINLSEQETLRFYKMYGMTEATGRIAVLPPEQLASHPSSVGRVVSPGALSVRDDEIIYEGPNVTPGYARSGDDLAWLPPVEPLVTGDLGRIDGDGRLFLTGRRSRIAKVLGGRINLDDLEDVLSTETGAAVAIVSRDEAIHIYFEDNVGSVGQAEVTKALTAFGVPRQWTHQHRVTSLPRTDSGKLDRRGL